MTRTGIVGIGCLCALGNTPEQVWSNLTTNENESGYLHGCAYDFISPVSGLDKRRMTRYTLIGLYTICKALADSNITLTDEMREKVGTIFSSGYGSLDTNIKFAKQVLTGDPECCSPLLFSNTVANSCLGHICMRNGFKGVSTMLTGSNNIKYAKCLLEEQKAELIFSGYIEEYNEDLFKSYLQYDCLNASAVSECVITFLLSSREKQQKDYYCMIDSIREVNLGFNPIMNPEDTGRATDKIVERCMKSAVEESGATVDAIFTGGGSTAVDRIEQETTGRLFPRTVHVNNIKELFGETLGCSFNANLMTASLCLKHGAIPGKLCGNEAGVRLRSVLVNGYGLSGNFVSVVLTQNRDLERQ